MTPEQIQKLTDDLRAFAASSLDHLRGSPSSVEHTRLTMAQPLTLMGVVRAAERLASLIPHLLEDARQDASLLSTRMHRTQLPKRAGWPRSPAGFARHAEQLYPRFWLRPTEQQRAGDQELRWLLGQVDLIAQHLERHAQGASQYVAELEQVTQQVDHWTAVDLQRAKTYTERIGHARGALQRAKLALYKEAGKRIVPSVQRPTPFPNTPSWRHVAHLMGLWSDPKRATSGYLSHALAGYAALEDLPFLYQRWCSVQLLQVLKIRGWTPTEPPTWPVLMGGRCELKPPFPTKRSIHVWFEPHIGHQEHPSGLRLVDRSIRAVSPDLLIQFTTPDGLQSVILDPTLSTNREQLERKGRYLRMLESVQPRLVAGVPVGMKTPLRSWAICPMPRTTCEVLRRNGSVGVIPLVPGQPRAALQDFLEDILRWTV